MDVTLSEGFLIVLQEVGDWIEFFDECTSFINDKMINRNAVT